MANALPIPWMPLYLVHGWIQTRRFIKKLEPSDSRRVPHVVSREAPKGPVLVARSQILPRNSDLLHGGGPSRSLASMAYRCAVHGRRGRRACIPWWEAVPVSMFDRHHDENVDICVSIACDAQIALQDAKMAPRPRQEQGAA